jgi:alpha-L-fucosidase
MDAYEKYLQAQITELIKNYGPLLTIWNDVPREFRQRGLATIKLVRELQPSILINNRTGAGGDYDTPEQKIGGFNMARPWESCMTVSAHNHWAWGGADDGVKPLADCLLMLIRSAGGDGNVLLNVGPRPDGVIDPEQAGRLRDVGVWLEKYGESIYGTRGGPYMPTKSVVSTRKGTTVYIHITDWPKEKLVLPPLSAKILKSSLLTGGEVVVTQTKAGVEISIPVSDRQEIDTIVKLELDQPAMSIDPITLDQSCGNLVFGKKATASNVLYQNNKGYLAKMAIDGDSNTRWATDANVDQCWLEVDLGKPGTFNRAIIEEYSNRVKSFELQYKDGNDWKTFYEGGGINNCLAVNFDPVTAQVVRFLINGKGGPSIFEFQLFAPRKK